MKHRFTYGAPVRLRLCMLRAHWLQYPKHTMIGAAAPRARDGADDDNDGNDSAMRGAPLASVFRALRTSLSTQVAHATQQQQQSKPHQRSTTTSAPLNVGTHTRSRSTSVACVSESAALLSVLAHNDTGVCTSLLQHSQHNALERVRALRRKRQVLQLRRQQRSDTLAQQQQAIAFDCERVALNVQASNIRYTQHAQQTHAKARQRLQVRHRSVASGTATFRSRRALFAPIDAAV